MRCSTWASSCFNPPWVRDIARELDVEEEQVRISDQPEGQVYPALLATRKPVGAPIAETIKADQLQHLVDRPPPRVAGPVVFEHLPDGEFTLDPSLLEHDADAVSEAG